MRNIFDKKAYKPLPMGDGQNLALRLQASQFYSTYSFSFAEPWLGGQQPVQFSTSLQHTIQYRYDYFTGLADKSQSFQISGITLGLGIPALMDLFGKKEPITGNWRGGAGGFINLSKSQNTKCF